MSNQANDLYWVASRIAELSKEMATPDAGHYVVGDNFEELYAYVSRWQDDEGTVGGGLTFRLDDGRGISVGISLILVDD